MIWKRKNKSSRLRHRLTLQEEVMAPDSQGGYTRGWQNIADVWAEIIPLENASGTKTQGSEQLSAGQIQSRLTHKITLRYRNGVTTAMRLLFENRAFNIRHVANDYERNEQLDILAEEGVAT
jgi:SPP1 family predicted phage head-tail adaptor